MGQIKFRAWHKKYKKMYEVLHLHMESERDFFVTCKGYSAIEQKDIHIQIQPNKFILEQFINLKDKNGKEIYQGDVYLNDYKRPVVVTHDIKNTREFHGHSGYEDVVYSGYKVEADIEVIGNIHETPEYLNGN